MASDPVTNYGETANLAAASLANTTAQQNAANQQNAAIVTVQQHQVNPYPANSAAGIAWDIARSGGTVDPELAKTAQQEIGNVTATPVTFSHDALGNVTTKAVSQQNQTLTPVTFSHEGGNVVTKEVTANLPAPFKSTIAAPSEEALAGNLPKPFISTPQQPTDNLANTAIKLFENVPVIGNVARVAEMAVNVVTPAALALGSVVIPASESIARAAGIGTTVKATDLMSQDQANRLESVVQGYGAATDITVSTISSGFGLFPNSAIRPFADQNARTGLGAESDKVISMKNERANAINQLSIFEKSYDFDAAIKSLDATARANTNAEGIWTGGNNFDFVKASQEIENERSMNVDAKGFWTGSQASLDAFNTKIENYNKASSEFGTNSQASLNIFNQNVATYNERVAEAQKLNQNVSNLDVKALESGVYVVRNGQIIENPLNARSYGTFSDWGRSTSGLMMSALSINPEKIAAYEVSQKNFEGNEGIGFGYGMFKEAVLSPENVLAAIGSGAQFAVIGGGISSIGKAGIAAAADSSIPTVSKIATTIGSTAAKDIWDLAVPVVGLGLIGNMYIGKTPVEMGETSTLLLAGYGGMRGASSGISAGTSVAQSIPRVADLISDSVFNLRQNMAGVTRLTPDSGLSYYQEPVFTSAKSTGFRQSISEPKYMASDMELTILRPETTVKSSGYIISRTNTVYDPIGEMMNVENTRNLINIDNAGNIVSTGTTSRYGIDIEQYANATGRDLAKPTTPVTTGYGEAANLQVVKTTYPGGRSYENIVLRKGEMELPGVYSAGAISSGGRTANEAAISLDEMQRANVIINAPARGYGIGKIAEGRIFEPLGNYVTNPKTGKTEFVPLGGNVIIGTAKPYGKLSATDIPTVMRDLTVGYGGNVGSGMIISETISLNAKNTRIVRGEFPEFDVMNRANIQDYPYGKPPTRGSSQSIFQNLPDYGVMGEERIMTTETGRAVINIAEEFPMENYPNKMSERMGELLFGVEAQRVGSVFGQFGTGSGTEKITGTGMARSGGIITPLSKTFGRPKPGEIKTKTGMVSLHKSQDIVETTSRIIETAFQQIEQKQGGYTREELAPINTFGRRVQIIEEDIQYAVRVPEGMKRSRPQTELESTIITKNIQDRFVIQDAAIKQSPIVAPILTSKLIQDAARDLKLLSVQGMSLRQIQIQSPDIDQINKQRQIQIPFQTQKPFQDTVQTPDQIKIQRGEQLPGQRQFQEIIEKPPTPTPPFYKHISIVPPPPGGFPSFGSGGGAGGASGKRYRKFTEVFSFDIARPGNMVNPFAIPKRSKAK